MAKVISADQEVIIFIEEFIKKKLIENKSTVLKEMVYEKLDRVGFSGVSIYVVSYTTSKVKSYRKCIFKVAPIADQGLEKKLTKEKNNHSDHVSNFLPYAPQDCKQHRNKKFTGLAYFYKESASNLANTINLHDLFLKSFINENDKTLTDQIRHKISYSIGKIYTTCIFRWKADYEQLNNTWQEQYDHYIRWHRSKDRICGILNCKPEQDFIYYNDRKFSNPVRIIEKITAERFEFISRTVHGDLHQRNILLDDDLKIEEAPYLIDFEWTSGNKHYLIDYALLECSIKLQYLTSLLVDNEIRSFEKQLNNNSSSSSFKYSRIEFIFQAIKQIRNEAFEEYCHAAEELGIKGTREKWYAEYNKSLIMITAGLLGVASFEEIDKRGLICSLIFQCEECISLDNSDLHLNEIGEYKIVNEHIYSHFNNEGYSQIIIDKGDDCSVFNVLQGNVVVASTDPCPLPVAWLLGDLDFKIYGWYSLLINLSDLASMGAKPVGIHLAVEMPEDLRISEFNRFLEGVKIISDKYKCPVIGGNVKDGVRFLSTGTIFGQCSSDNLLLRKNASVGDTVIVIGTMGIFWSIVYDYDKPKVFTDKAEKEKYINFPEPKIEEGLLLSEYRIASCCMDSSDGVISCFHEIATQSNIDIILDHDKIIDSLDKRVKQVAELYDVEAFSLALSWGDWQLVVTVNEEKMKLFREKFAGIQYHIVGTVAAGDRRVRAKIGQELFNIVDFGSKRFDANSYFSNGIEAYKESLKTNFLKPVTP